MFVIEFSIFDDLSKSLDFITMETNAINTLNDRLHRMTSQDLHPLAIQEDIDEVVEIRLGGLGGHLEGLGEAQMQQS